MKTLKTRLIIPSLLILTFAPLSAGAQCPGNLRDGIDDTGPVRADDTQLVIPYTDIAEAWVRPADGYPATELGIRTTEPIPFYPPYNYNIFFFFDADGNVVNNDLSGTRAGSDLAFSLLFSQEQRDWRTVIWNYDPATGEWTSALNPNVLWASDYGGFIIHVPFELLPEGNDWPWRVAVAASDEEGATSGDTYPDGEGERVSCPDGDEEPEVTSGVPEETPSGGDGTTTGETVDGGIGEGLPWWYWFIGIVILAGGGLLIGEGLKRRGGGMGTPEPPPETPEEPAGSPEEPPDTGTPEEPSGEGVSGEETGGEETPPSEPPPEEPPPIAPPERMTCNCPTCRAYIVIGSDSDRALGSAANLGKAIRRDTEKPDSGVPQKDRCVKVVRFSSPSMTSGERVTTNGSGGDVKWKRFSNREKLFTEDGWDDVCLWKEVMLVHHGESERRVKKIIGNIREIIPRQPIERLVLYYCGGEGTLPMPEFRSLAYELGLRLKMIPEECRPERVHIYLAPTIEFGGEESFTKLVIEEQGLVSYEGLMKHYSVDEDGNITEHGNERPPGGQIFGSVPLGRLNENDNLDAEAYRDNWRRIARLPLPDIERYRQRIKDAGLDEPPLTPKEAKAQEIERICREAGIDPPRQPDIDRMVEQPNREIRRELRDYARSQQRRR